MKVEFKLLFESKVVHSEVHGIADLQDLEIHALSILQTEIANALPLKATVEIDQPQGSLAIRFTRVPVKEESDGMDTQERPEW